MATSTIKPKRGTTAQWAKSKRILEWNEWGVEETGSGEWILRVGDGEHEFLDLPKVIDTPSLNDLVAEAQNTYNLFFDKAEAMEDRFEELSAEITSKHETAISDIETKGAETLATIPEDYTETYNRAVKNSKDIEFVTSTATRNDKRLTNVEKALFKEPFVIDSSVAYTKEVPQNALPYAEVGAVGGMTRKCANLAKPRGDINVNGFTTALNDDGSVTLRGSATAKQDTVIQLIDIDRPVDMTASNTYSITVLKDGVNTSRWGCRVDYTDDIGGNVYGWNAQDISRPRKLVRLYLQFTPEVGDTTYNGTYTVMLNEGTDPLPYEPYFEGLRSAPVTEVESVGANLIPFPYVDGMSKTHNGITYTVNSDGSIHAKGTAEGNSYFYLTHAIEWNDKTISAMDSVKTLNGKTYKDCMYYSANKQLMLSLSAGISVDRTYFPMINKGDTALPYTPYVRNSLPIPDEVKALDGYGWGINDEVYNYVDWEKKQFVKRVERVVYNGTERWYLDRYNSHGAYVYTTELTSTFLAISNTFALTYGSWGEKGVGYFSPNGKQIFFNSDKATVEEWKAYLTENPVTIYYELAEPIITDISHLLTSDNLIPVEGNGTVTMLNEYGYAVPSEVVYRLEEGESA